MSFYPHLRKLLKRVILGPGDFPQQCPVGLRDPQAEVAVTLHGLGPAREVTSAQMMACGAPFLIGIGFESAHDLPTKSHARLSLQFHARDHQQTLLGEIALRHHATLPLGAQRLCLFEIAGCENHCLSKPRLWARYLQYARQRQNLSRSEVPITAREVHAMIVFYICPRPIVLVSAAAGDSQNIFPMNLMGSINSTRAVAPLVERAQKIAVCDVPLDNAAQVFQLGANHRKTSIDLAQLPFPTKSLPTLDVPVPHFTLRVREIQIASVHPLGSHTLFLGRTTQDHRLADAPQLFVVHGIYQSWRHISSHSNPAVLFSPQPSQRSPRPLR
jgi:flavin reductase (DIM6/NTAB) family NADH-FMN oxidoreductase RutF